MRRFVHPAAVRASAEDLFARMVLNIFVTNDDDPLRNHGFVRDPRPLNAAQRRCGACTKTNWRVSV